ncbi:hypothetical protein B9Z55_003215 [Caenorhabditis nigoni]|uniref:INSulin related n=1 Tax=Caenorhabditis nigoni TaxID=1611254 RepID=A0A2G5VP22_9PELO|nr:hypothetical protein B9Z55_003215 [Caenorhabditis nigoni]
MKLFHVLVVLLGAFLMFSDARSPRPCAMKLNRIAHAYCGHACPKLDTDLIEAICAGSPVPESEIKIQCCPP